MKRSAAFLTVSILCASSVCMAKERIQLLVIGNNQPSVADSPGGDSGLPALRFADDDAAAFYDLASSLSDTAHLLTVFDSETARRYPGLTGTARPPTVAELRAAVAAIGKRVEATRSQDQRSVVYVFFSGHGAVVEGQGPTLALLDGGISHAFLYEEILSKLPADTVHLFIDACHAEAVVRPRDVQAKTVSVAPTDASAFLAHSTLSRFPHVGAVVAASSDAQAHEWDALGHGVFTYELVSALRGAADVNRDGRIEYSEIYAFLGAANRAVDDPRGRLTVVARPPAVNRHVAVMDLSWFPAGTTARLRGVPARAGLVQVEDGNGRRLVSLHGEPQFVADLLLPAGLTYVRAGRKEAQFNARPGDSVNFDSLSFRDAQARPRGSLESAVRRGLFAGEFGRGYYAGFIDQAPDFVPVSFVVEPEPERLRADPPSSTVTASRERPSGPNRLVMVGLGASTAVAREFEFSEALRAVLIPEEMRGPTVSVEVARAAQPDLAEWRAAALLGWLRSGRAGSVRGWAGASAGIGMIAQTATDSSARWSATLEGGPNVGASLEVSRAFGLWTEAHLRGMTYRKDGHAAFGLAPSVFLGAWLGF